METMNIHHTYRKLKNKHTKISSLILKTIIFIKVFLNAWFRLKSIGGIKKYLNLPIKKLHIGCGPNILKGWINTDINYKNQAIYFDASKKFPIQDNSFDYIFSEHIFEHLNLSEEKNMLNESFRILKKDGVLRIATPNIKFIINLYLDNQNTLNKKYVEWSAKQFLPNIYEEFFETNVMNIFVINNFFKDWGHQIIHSYESLNQMLKNAGFTKIFESKIGISQFKELNGIEKHGNSITPEFNELETLVIEAIK